MRDQPGSRYQRGISQLELAVSLVLFTIFLAVFLDRAFYYQEYAEKAAMEMTVANMRTGLRYKIADLMLQGRLSAIPTLADENPVTWLDKPPENYLGAFELPPTQEIEGKWYYDTRRRELVYTVNNRRHFVSQRGREFTVRYRTTRISSAVPGASMSAPFQQWVALTQPEAYTWLQ